MTAHPWSSERQREADRPHVLIDSKGMVRSGQFKSRAAATRALKQMQRRPSPFLLADPKTWTVQPVEES